MPDQDENHVLLAMTTLPDQQQATRMADALVTQALAACVHIERIDSIYSWQGKTCHETEYRLLIKTMSRCWPDLQAVVQGMHPYEVPALLSWRAEAVLPAYERWIAAQTQDALGASS